MKKPLIDRGDAELKEKIVAAGVRILHQFGYQCTATNIFTDRDFSVFFDVMLKDHGVLHGLHHDQSPSGIPASLRALRWQIAAAKRARDGGTKVGSLVKICLSAGDTLLMQATVSNQWWTVVEVYPDGTLEVADDRGSHFSTGVRSWILGRSP